MIGTPMYSVGEGRFIKEKIKKSSDRIKTSFMNQSLDLRNMYINKLNSIACGMETRQVPWNELTEEDEIQEILRQHPEYELDYNLELYEEKMLSMGLDPTEGMFAQFPPGQPVLTSGRFRHLNRMNEVIEQEHLNNPMVAEMMGVQRPQPQETQLEQDYYTRAHAHQIQQSYAEIYAIGMAPQMPYTPWPIIDMNIVTPTAIKDFYIPLIDIPKRVYDMTIQPPEDISAEMADVTIPYEVRYAKYEATLKYYNEYVEYMKGAQYEQTKQQVYNSIRELLDQRQVLLNSNYYYMTPEIRRSWEMDIQRIDMQIQTLQNSIPQYERDEFWALEQKALEYNYQADKYNKAKLKYYHDMVERSIDSRPNVPKFILAEDLIAQGCRFDSKTKEWYDSYGLPLHPEKRAAMIQVNAVKSQLMSELEARDRRIKLTEDGLFYFNLFKNAMLDSGYDMETIDEIWAKNDPFGINYNLDYNPYYQTPDTWEEYYKRVNPTVSRDYSIEFEKDIKDMSDEEREVFVRRRKAREMNQRAAGVIMMHPDDLLRRKYGRGTMDGGFTRVYGLRFPFTAALQEYKETYDPNKKEGMLDFANYTHDAYVQSEQNKRLTTFQGLYDRQALADTLDNFAFKTQIGRTSDLLNEMDSNVEFAKAMNEGVLGLSLPNELGYNYNKRRIGFDNSILQNMERVKQRLPEGARIKDPDVDTYNDSSLEQIQKERYSNAMRESKRLKEFFSPELGGTWDASAVND